MKLTDYRRETLHCSSPSYAPISEWGTISGMSRSEIYRRLAAGDLVAKKLGSRTLIDVEAGLAWMRSLPPATFRMPK
jgi:hypothetical protein